ncbi:FeoA family protein [Blattabacterium cuenoti]|uniref:FeoA family protein n=1 Tax=Blattabacterium cuenoti TaxID=1653831 RepID=UPI00163B71DC|nr:FeoA family protein [Blattabacterium cuenoti]
MNLSNLKKGEKGIIKGYKYNNENFPIKLLELGILPGVEFEILFVSIFYDPLCISYNQSCLALRKEEADNIIIEPLKKCKKCKEE